MPPKKENTPPVGPIVLGFFLFVVVGSGTAPPPKLLIDETLI